VGGANVLPKRKRERRSRRPSGGSSETHSGRRIDPAAPALFLDFTIDLLTAFPFPAEFQESGPVVASVRFTLLVQFIAVMMVARFDVMILRRSEAVRDRNPALHPVTKARVLRALAGELVERARADLKRTGDRPDR